MANSGIEFVDYNNQVEVSANKTLTLADSGVVQNVKANATLTLPTPAAGNVMLVRVGAPGLTVSVAPGSGVTISGGGLTAAAAKAVVFTNQPAGSLIELVGSSSTAWSIGRLNGVVTNA